MKHYAFAGGMIAGLATIALAVSYAQTSADPFVNCRADHGIAVEELGASFTLTDETGQRVRDTDVITQPTLLYFGYSFCPDVCPLDNARNAEAAYLLAEDGIDLQTLFISVDPARDTPEVLHDFTDNFHPDMIGLTGTPEELAQLAAGYRTFYDIHEPDFDGYYLIDHSTYSYLVLPEHGVVEVVLRADPAFDVADRAACIVNTAA